MHSSRHLDFDLPRRKHWNLNWCLVRQMHWNLHLLIEKLMQTDFETRSVKLMQTEIVMHCRKQKDLCWLKQKHLDFGTHLLRQKRSNSNLLKVIDSSSVIEKQIDSHLH